MRIGFLFGGEINSVRSPADKSGIFIERFRQNLRRAAFRGHHGDLCIRVVKEFRACRRLECNLFSIRRPFRIRVRPRRVHNFLYGFICNFQCVNIFGKRGNQVRVLLSTERDARSIRRPRETPYAERISFRKALCLGSGVHRIVRQIDDPEMRHLVIGVNHGVFAVFFFAVLQRFWFRVQHRKSDAPGIRRPIESIHIIFSLGNLLRLAAVRGNNVELFLAFRRVLDLSGPVGKKRDPFSVRRPRGIGARFFRRSQRVRFAGCNVHNPQVPVERVVLPIGLLHFVNHALPIRRNFWTERVFPFE